MSRENSATWRPDCAAALSVWCDSGEQDGTKARLATHQMIFWMELRNEIFGSRSLDEQISYGGTEALKR
jgi:hypothetical protein